MRKFFYTLTTVAFIFIIFMIGVGIGASSGFFKIDKGDKVAILTIDDIILDSDTYLESIDSIRKDKNIKAAVVRINSPGGAVSPSQEIYSELKKLGSVMPVVASMSTVAASGGYYIACAADTIFANPGTITGSIGVSAQFVNYRELLSWAKLDVEVVKSGDFKDIGSPLRDMTESEREYLQDLIDTVHSQFKSAVASSRDLNEDMMEKISDGQIFSGEKAKEINLIDELGNLNDAIKFAAERAGIEDEPAIVKYPKQKSLLRQLLSTKTDITRMINQYPSTKSFGLFYIVDIIH